MCWSVLSNIKEDLLLEVKILVNSLNNKVNIAKLLNIGGPDDTTNNIRHLLLC